MVITNDKGQYVLMKRFNRARESLERVRKLSARIPRVQINVAAEGGQQNHVAAYSSYR
jgi:predicted fused transcriptional regulator/phosphomethylpyrimidine kinase